MTILLRLLSFTTLMACSFAPSAFAQDPSYSCGGQYRCGSERITGTDDRVKPPVIQPQGQTLQSPCGGIITPDVSYGARIHGVTCGEGAVAKARLPLAVDKDVLEKWDVTSRSGLPDAQQRMQAMRQIDFGWKGSIDYAMWESWTYKIHRGDFAARCGSEPWYTTCARDREKEVEYTVDVDDTSRCLEYAPDPVPSSSGSSGSGSSFSPPPSPYKNNSPATSGSSGVENSYKKGVDDAFKRNPDSAAQGQCIRYAKKKEKRTRWDPAGTINYRCEKTRYSWCTWFDDQSMSRSCKNHTAQFTVKYAKDPKWKPGYVDAKNPRIRDYHDHLPNKFDLLPGESERVITYSNVGSSSTLRPQVQVDSKYNEYTFVAEPAAIRCEYNMNPTINFKVNTVGRIKAKSPNVLALPVNLDGTPGQAFETENGLIKILPQQMFLQDQSRAMMLQASLMSRTFSKPQGSETEQSDPKAIHKEIKTDEAVGTAASLGFWVDTQFKVQMYRRGGRKGLIRMTPSNSFPVSYVDMFDDSVTFRFEKGRLPETFYRGAGPLQGVLGAVWRGFGVELSPGAKYVMRVQIAQRGLPFYESGCSGGRDVCEGEQANKKAFSEPMDVEFTAAKDIERSWLRRFKDWQEKWVIF